MSMEFTPPSNIPHEVSAELHPTSTSTEIATAFQTGPAETVLSCTDRRATDMQPEATDLVPQRQEYQPVATVHERAVMGRQSVYLRDEHGQAVAMNAHGEAYLKNAVRYRNEYWQGKILDAFQSQSRPEGLSLERGNEFLGSLGLAATMPTLELPDDLQQEVNKMHPLHGERLFGVYLTTPDVVITFRHTRLEELNGPEFSERNRIHEMVHGNQEHRWYFRFINDEPDMKQPAVAPKGYCDDPDNLWKGDFLNEGVPEMIATQYVTEVLGKPHGLLDLPEESYAVDTGIHLLSMPSRHIYLNEVGRKKSLRAAYAAAALEELVAIDPALRPALIHGNYDGEARKEVAGRIDAICPGLFTTLNQDQTINTAFFRGLQFVRQLLE